MSDKKVKKFVKVQIEAGKATPAAPLGPALGQAGVNIGEFTKKFNEVTKDMSGLLSVKIYAYEDRTYDFVAKTPITTGLLKKAAGITKGSGRNTTTKVAKIPRSKLEEIAAIKMKDLTANTVDQAVKILEGSARSMGIEITK
jgi:large subunit ribosomal protein L11